MQGSEMITDFKLYDENDQPITLSHLVKGAEKHLLPMLDICRYRYEEIERRFPVLIDAMKWAAILSTTEAADCIRAIVEQRGSGEAVEHFGGPLAVFRAAMRCRRFAYQVRKERRLRT